MEIHIDFRKIRILSYYYEYIFGAHIYQYFISLQNSWYLWMIYFEYSSPTIGRKAESCIVLIISVSHNDWMNIHCCNNVRLILHFHSSAEVTLTREALYPFPWWWMGMGAHFEKYEKINLLECVVNMCCWNVLRLVLLQAVDVEPQSASIYQASRLTAFFIPCRLRKTGTEYSRKGRVKLQDISSFKRAVLSNNSSYDFWIIIS